MDDELRKILVQLMEGQESLRISQNSTQLSLEEMRIGLEDMKIGQNSLQLGQEEMRKDIAKLGAKIDGEISDKLTILFDEQSIIRKEISEINQGRIEDRLIIQDIKLAVDALNSNQKRQEGKIIELDQRIAK